MIDLRSDTVTQPTKAMLSAMMAAPLGDDVYGEDPTVNRLEGIVAERAGMEAAVFAPSGTQSNLMGIMAHCQRGDEYLVGQTAHTYMWEGGGAAVLGSVQPQPLDFESDGRLCLKKAAKAIKPKDDHHPHTRLFCLENTTSGKVLPLDYLQTIKAFCAEHGLQSHLDGARVFNASVKQKVELQTISQHFDSISICLSKGLGAPVGSVLCGPKALIRQARRWRKVLGGGMRQAGMLAAAGIYALEHHVSRLSDDHDNAQFLAEQLAQMDEFILDKSLLQTNMLFIEARQDYANLQAFLKTKGILLPLKANRNDQLRLVTHLDVNRQDLEKVIHEIKQFYRA